MADTKRIAETSPGSNAVGAETNDSHPTGVSETETQLYLVSKSGIKHNKNVNDDEVVKNQNGEEFLQADETDE